MKFREIEEIVNTLIEILCNREYNTHYEYLMWCLHTTHQLRYAIKELSINHVLGFIRCLRYVFEVAIQVMFMKQKFNNNEDRIIKELKRREKLGTSFTLKMITNVREMAGTVKKELIRQYIRLTSYVHPTYTLYTHRNIINKLDNDDVKIVEELFYKTIDSVLYIYMRLYNVCEKLCELCIKHSLSRCSKYCKRTQS